MIRSSAIALGAVASLAVGRPTDARHAIRQARRRLEERADRIVDPVVRLSFLSQVPDNARTVELAEEWAGVVSAPG